MQLDPEWSRCLYLPITRWMLFALQMLSGNVEFALLLRDASNFLLENNACKSDCLQFDTSLMQVHKLSDLLKRGGKIGYR